MKTVEDEWADMTDEQRQAATDAVMVKARQLGHGTVIEEETVEVQKPPAQPTGPRNRAERRAALKQLPRKTRKAWQNRKKQKS